MSGNDPLADRWYQVRTAALELGFDAVGVSGVELEADAARLLEWLDRGYHGEMEWMARHKALRSHPQRLLEGTVSVISVRLDYLPACAEEPWSVLRRPELGYISRYALGRDYHKLMRRRLQRLADRLTERLGPFRYRALTDSAPVLEKPLARNAGLGWIGKHTNLLHREHGSWFFIGELYTDLSLPRSEPVSDHCGRCTACITACPTAAIVAPYRLDARRCISYLTIEHAGSIPESLRPLMGNRIYGCDDCQLVCPWNRFAAPGREPDFEPRHGLDAAGLVALFRWSEEEFLKRTEGSAIRRIGHRRFLRNIAVALGNAPGDDSVIAALRARASHDCPVVREHVGWALRRHGQACADELERPHG